MAPLGGNEMAEVKYNCFGAWYITTNDITYMI